MKCFMYHLEVLGQRGASEISTRFGHEDTLALLQCQLQPSGLAYSQPLKAHFSCLGQITDQCSCPLQGTVFCFR